MDIQITNAGIGIKKDHPAAKNTNPSISQPVAGNAKIAGVSIITPANSSVATDTKAEMSVITATQAFTNGNITEAGKNQTDPVIAKTPVSQDNKNTTAAIPVPAVQNPAAKNNIDSAAIVKTDAPVEKNKDQNHKKSGNKFSINFSLGPDLSSVGLSRVGKVKNQYGVGIGYAFSDRISVRTGFYAGRKIYSADSTSYHNAYTSGTYSYKLYNIDANCLVYEVPVTVSYSFPSSKKYNWLVSTGLSSYFMKKRGLCVYLQGLKSSSTTLVYRQQV